MSIDNLFPVMETETDGERNGARERLRSFESRIEISCEVDEIKFCTGVGTSPEAVVDAVEKELGKGTRVYLEQ